MQRYVAWMAALFLTGCQELQIQYREPPDAGKVQEIAALAKEGYQYFELPKMVVVVAPTDVLGATPKANPSGAATETRTQRGSPGGGTVIIGTPPAAASSTAANTQKPNSPTVLQKSKSAQQATTGDESKSAVAKATDAAAAPQDSAGKGTVPTASTDTLGKETIDGQVWGAAVVPVADQTSAFSVRGVSGFWKNTTLSIAYYPNSDVPASISSKAENLFPKRVEQLTGIVTSIGSLAALIAVEGGSPPPPPTPLLPFKVEVPAASMAQKAVLQKGWTYQFTYLPNESPKGTIDLAQFKDLVRGQTVSYWPVPACRNVKLTLERDNQETHIFYLVVSSISSLRLQPLPLAGKADLGTICNASVSGQTAADPLGDLQNNLTALQQAEKKLSAPNAASSPKTGTAK